jgi:pilus assembly protein CpaF
MSFEVIIPFLKPIEPLLASRTVSEIMVNPDGSVWIEEKGRIELVSDIRFDEGALLTSLEVIANRFGKKLDADSPILNLRLPDGSRMAALIPPVVNPQPEFCQSRLHVLLGRRDQQFPSILAYVLAEKIKPFLDMWT